VAVSTAAGHGTATASGTSITYTPTSGYSGTDTFQYTVTTVGPPNPGLTSQPANIALTLVNTPVDAIPDLVAREGRLVAAGMAR